MRSNLEFEATTASERTLTLVGHEPSGVGGAQRRGGGKPAYRKGLGGSPAHTGDPPLLGVTKSYHEVLL